MFKSIKIKVLLGFGIAVTVVAVSCLLTYKSLDNLTRAMDSATENNYRIVLVKRIISSVDESERVIRSYSVNKSAEYLEAFNLVVNDIDNAVNELQEQCITDKAQLIRIDSLSTQINEKLALFNTIIRLRNTNIPKAILNDVEQKLSRVVLTGKNKPVEVVSTENKEEKKGFWSFLRKKDKKEEPKDLAAQEFIKDEPEADMAKVKIKQIITEAKQNQQNSYASLGNSELELLKQDKLVSERIRQSISGFEEHELNLNSIRIVESKKQSEQAVFIIGVSSGIGILCCIVFIFFITNDITRSNRYKAELILAQRKAEKLALAKEEFLANMSHEIRTPLNAIIGFSEQLGKTTDEQQQKKYTHALQKSSDHLLSLVNDILDYSKIESGKLTFEHTPFRITDVVQDVSDILKSEARKKRILLDIHIDEPETVLTGDPHRLKQIILNLVSNAIKFTEKGTVDILVSHLNKTETGQTLQVVVKDTGIGISSDNLEKIFNKFDQADNSTTRKYGGTGLGLSICKKLAKLQNGSIEAKSEFGKGSEFTLNIPYQYGQIAPRTTLSENGEAASSRMYANSLKGVKIMVIDDDETNLLLSSVILNKYDIELITAKDGKSALSVFKEQKIDIVFTDINMPDISGVDVVKHIRALKDKAKASVPVIALTANIRSRDIEKYVEAGMNDYLLKPYKEEELIRSLVKNLGIKEKEAKQVEIAAALNEKLYDLKDLERISGNDKKFVAKMLETFIQSSVSSVNGMKKSVEQENWEEAGNIAHKSIPSYFHLGMTELAEKLKTIEHQALYEKKFVSIPELVDTVEKGTTVVIPLLQNELRRLKN